MTESKGRLRISAQRLGKMELWEAQTSSLQSMIKEKPKPKDQRPVPEQRASSFWIDSHTLGFTTTTSPWNPNLPQDAHYLLGSAWNDNAVVTDGNGKPLRKHDSPMINVCKLRDIITFNGRDYPEVGIHCIKLRPPLNDNDSITKFPTCIKNWCTSIMSSIPWNLWSIKEEVIKPWALPDLKDKLYWSVQSDGVDPIIAASLGSSRGPQVFRMTPGHTGLSWQVAWIDKDFQTSEDCKDLQVWGKKVGWTFLADPRISPYPWTAHPATFAKHVEAALRKQRTKRSKLYSPYNLNALVEKIQTRATSSTWGQAALQQHPSQFWNREGLFTDYQNWTSYRIALGVLNVRHAGWPKNRQCPDPDCACLEETTDHIIWQCAKAATAWKSWVSQWLGGECSNNQLQSLRSAIAGRVAPPIYLAVLSIAHQCIGRWTHSHTAAMNLLWKIWTTTTPAMLWRLRVEAVFKNKISNEATTRATIMSAGTYQVQAIVSAWKRNPAKRHQAICLDVCQQIMNTAVYSPPTKTIQAWVLEVAYKTNKRGG